MHRAHHNAKRPARCSAIALTLALAACAPTTRPDPPGLLGALTDRPPPAIAIDASGPYGDPLAEPVPPLISAAIADQIVAAPLRASLAPEARLSLAEASQRAAAAATGAIVQWQSADAAGAVMPARDPYRSHRGEICRDLQQGAQTASGAAITQITLCHADLGDGRVFWLPGGPD